MPEETVLAFDFGKKRIGVAVGEIATHQAHPLQVILKNSNTTATIQMLLNTWHPAHLVVGLPIHPNGQPHEMAKPIKYFTQQLKTMSDAKIWWVDEQYTSCLATSRLREIGIQGKKQKAILDQVAAQVILEAWLANGGVAIDAR